jgi:superoxide dismutase, Fe-Mn family
LFDKTIVCVVFLSRLTKDETSPILNDMFTLPNLPFEPTALKPVISAKTIEFHYGKHHAGYVTKLNELLTPYEFFQNYELDELLLNIKKLPVDAQQPILNNAGQVYNHNLYWESIQAPTESNKPTGDLLAKIETRYGSFEEFCSAFTQAGIGQFGSGWVWLSLDKNDDLVINKTANADSPLLHNKTPLLTMDVWEHAYYLDYQNLRAKYIEGFFSIINWIEVSRKYAEAISAEN